VRAAASMKKKLMINMGRWGLGTYPERRHLRTAESALQPSNSLLPTYSVSASREEAPHLALSRDYESAGSRFDPPPVRHDGLSTLKLVSKNQRV
jgi:hypothetical protein